MQCFPHLFSGSPVFRLLLGLLTARYLRGERDAVLEGYVRDFPFRTERERLQIHMALDLLDKTGSLKDESMNDDVSLLRNRLVLLLVAGNAEKAEAEALEFLTSHHGCSRELLEPIRPLLPYISSPRFHAFFERFSF